MYLWAALSLTACTADDDPSWPPGGVPLELSAVVQGYAGSGADTRAATTENRWEGGEVVWLCEDKENGLKDIYTVNVDGRLIHAYQHTSPWDWDWINPYKKRTFYAYYPGTWSGGKFTVRTDQNSGGGYQASDRMCTPKTSFAISDAVKVLHFYHLTAKVLVHLKAGKGVTKDDLLHATVTFENLATRAECEEPGTSLPNAYAPQSALPGNSTIIPNEVAPAADGYVRTLRALLVPQDMSGRKFVKIVTKDGRTFYYIPARDEANFTSRKMYEFRLTVTSEGIERTDVGGATWKPAD